MSAPCISPVLLIFAKAPEPGQVKTRLCPPLSALQAAFLAEGFLLDTLVWVRQVWTHEIQIAYSGSPSWFEQAAPDLPRFAQAGGDLGNRLQQAFQFLGPRPVVCIGSDSPHLRPQTLQQARAALRQVDVVLGPAQDGGYYLVGTRQPLPIFTDMPMSTEYLLQATLAKLRQLQLSWTLLDPDSDLDTWADVQRLRDRLPFHSRQRLARLGEVG